MRGQVLALAALVIGAAACATPQGPAAAAAQVAATTVAAPVQSPTDVTVAFYKAYRTLPDYGGIPDAKNRAKLEPYISPALNQLLIDGDAAEDRYAKATKNEEPPLMEGDVFTANFEGATSVGNPVCNWTGQKGTCSVALTYDDKKEKPFTWTDKVDLVLTDKGWRVDDIEYGGTWDFGNKGTLQQNLKAVIEESKKPVE